MCMHDSQMFLFRPGKNSQFQANSKLDTKYMVIVVLSSKDKL